MVGQIGHREVAGASCRTCAGRKSVWVSITSAVGIAAGLFIVTYVARFPVGLHIVGGAALGLKVAPCSGARWASS